MNTANPFKRTESKNSNIKLKLPNSGQMGKLALLSHPSIFPPCHRSAYNILTENNAELLRNNILRSFGIWFQMSPCCKSVFLLHLLSNAFHGTLVFICLFVLLWSLHTDQCSAVLELYKLMSSCPKVERLHKTQLLTLWRLRIYKHCHVYAGMGGWL